MVDIFMIILLIVDIFTLIHIHIVTDTLTLCIYIQDEELLLLSMKDMNIAKLTSVDLPLFNGIVSDLFPGIETPAIDYSKFKSAIENQFKTAGLQAIHWAVTKVIQVNNHCHTPCIMSNRTENH